MPRPAADNARGRTYHVMNRGNRKAPIFEDERDCLRFLAILNRAREEHLVDVLGLSLMINHFHMLVSTPEGNLSAFMQQLEGAYARYSNWRHKRVGHVFQDRYRCVVIENDVHLLIAACYVFMNPVVARLTTHLAGWKWSTFAATAGLTAVPRYLTLTWIDTLFPAASRHQSQQRFRELMNHAKPVQAYLNEQPSLEVESFRTVVASFIGAQYYQAKLPRPYRSAFRPRLDELFSRGNDQRARDKSIHQAHVIHGYRLAEIAAALGLHPDTVGRYYRRFRSESVPDPDSG